MTRPVPPIRAEVLGLDALERLGEGLAIAHRVEVRRRGPVPLLRRLEENGRAIRRAYGALTEAVERGHAISPGAEWLIDNIHVAEERVRAVRDALPPSYLRELPRLTEGELAGHPRVYALVWSYVAHTDSRFHPDTLRRVVDAYQRREPLTMGELWALPATFDLLLLENLRRIADGILHARRQGARADELADGLSALSPADPDDEFEPSEEEVVDPDFAAGLVQRLREGEPWSVPVLAWLERRLAEQGTTPEEVVRRVQIGQVATHATVGNVVTSMRQIGAFDWPTFFESVSPVERALRDDPAGVYARMDFATRDLYRHAVEELARGADLSELEVARRVLDRAAAAADGERTTGSAIAGHVGYWLLRDGRRPTERDLGYRVPFGAWLKRAFIAAATPGYLGTIGLVTALLMALLLVYLAGLDVSTATLVALGLLALVPASDLAIAVVHRDLTELLEPRRLPKLDFSSGVPPEHRTLVAVPAILHSESEVRDLVESLEHHFLANQQANLTLALLSDWEDADEESLPADDRLLAAAASALAELNERYGLGSAGTPRFLLLHRRRMWNPEEERWMGWERKRGKIHELNRFLRGDRDTSILDRADGLTDPPPDVRYVIALDADTRLPPGSAVRLVGALAHPLNRPRFDPERDRVVAGYGVLQPRITPVLPPRGKKSLYHRIYSGPTGIDPYSAAVSNVYQDLFGEGSYVGKGVYDLEAFEAALVGRAPENAILSHDLFEGTFARSGSVTDIELFDDFPSDYVTAARRAHRWARGDWQLLPWIFGSGPSDAERKTEDLPVIARWKMLDNLRRTLSPPSTFLLLVAGWALLPVSPLLWTGFVVAMIAVPAAVPVVAGLVPRRRGIAKRSHFRTVVADALEAGARVVLEVVFVADGAVAMVDAIARALYRTYASGRRKLEWVTAAQAVKGAPRDVAGMYRALWAPVALALAAAAILAALRPQALPAAAPVIALWIASPLLALLLGRPFEAHPVRLEPADAASLRRVARRTWAYFESMVGENGLPPDNLQTDPAPVVARRTSPTNVGTYLLAVLAARDFGWIGTEEMADRLERTINTVSQRLKRFHGHLFNWYDIETLEPLHPRYVSTVDSGNLAGHLWTLAQGSRDLAAAPPLGPRALDGVADAVAMARTAASRVEIELPLSTVTTSDLERTLAQLGEDLTAPLATASEWDERLASLAEGASALVDIAVTGREVGTGAGWEELVTWARAAEAAVASHARDLAAMGEDRDECPPELARRLRRLAARADALVESMDFSFLYDRERKLFPIGYRVEEGGFDTGYYDLLASEAHLASFVAIAKGDVPVEHWFHLGRAVTPVGGGAALVSWSGSMFEYLMPALVLEPPPSTVLERTQRHIVARQIRYGAERGVPWGISESAYNARDRELTYQYSHFGIPGLGLTRGLVDDLVVAPYATALAAMVDPGAARRNFERLAEEGARGPLGFYEALDYTPSRVPDGERVAVVRAYMTHHKGMTIVALDNVLNGGIMRRRFHDVPRVAASELLLQERIPRDIGVARPHAEEVRAVRHVREIEPPVVRTFRAPWAGKPRAHLLSNGRYTVMVTASGSGFSRREDLAVTRWREDPTRDALGTYVYLRDVQSGSLWSAGFQPTGAEPDRYEASFSEDRVEIHRIDEAIETTTEIVVSPEDDGELRRVTLKNLGARTREIELTSYAEVVLAPPAADLAHPAFSKLFVETQYVPAFGALLAHRRPRRADEPQPWAVHVSAVQGETVGALQYETDRARLLDRGRSIRAPSCVVDGRPLSQTVGPVLDPVFALRRTVRLRSGESARVVFATMVAPDRESAVELADKYDESVMFERAASLAWTRAQVELQHLEVTAHEARLFQRLAGSLMYPDPDLRATSAVLANARGQRALWKHGISGDLPIVHVTIDQLRDRDVVRQLFRAHEYWGEKGLAVDIVVVNEHEVSYGEDLQNWLERSITRLHARVGHETHGAHGDVFLFRADRLSPEELNLVRAAAAVVLRASRGKLVEQLDAREAGVPEPPPLPIRRSRGGGVTPPRLRLEFFNGLGGFAEGGREYVIVLGESQWTPAPWVNVIANPDFGFVVSESGAGYTWAVNSRENRLTPWSNDPVQDPPGEALYVRDEDSGEVWTPTALPVRGPDPYVCRHGAGYSRFEHRCEGIALELLVFAPLEGPVRISRLTIRNESGRRRRLSVTAYVEWVLGAFRESSAPHVVTRVDEATGAIFARNRWNDEFAERVAFVDLGGRQRSWTCDRTEFLGRTGAIDRPAAMRPDVDLSGAVGAGLDPCAALRAPVSLAPRGSAEIVFLLGQGADAAEARGLVERYRGADLDAELGRVTTWWDDVLGTVQVDVPDPSMSILLNRWLLYQALACRVWARSAFYQSGGAYGFRDQLQDVMALTVSRREVAREHILRAAAHQFPEGDVLHWWHPPSGRGVRTRIKDDRLWLPYALGHYLDVTGDATVLDEEIRFLEADPLGDEEHEAYIEPTPAGEPATLFEHCARAVDVSLETGSHGLPLMGTGDWNDGMDRVGIGGQGESVWLGWFLHAVLGGMIPLAEERGQITRAKRWWAALGELRTALEEAGWDGDWYRRAYFDDGTPLGSTSNEECRIDSIAQSWAVMSGGAPPDRATRAMRAVEQYLVRPGDGLVLLFAPPFDVGALDPGYIQGYPPGIRENGGQYTHAAIWTVIAKAILGEGDAAAALFSILNPVNQTSTRAGVHRYKVEPYVAVADVYASPSHVGRGGWTWYTGSAGWMYRAGVEWILGFRLRGTTLHLDPCIPRNWEGYELFFRYHSARYTVVVTNPHGATRGISRVEVDGTEVAPVEREGLPPAASVELVDDGREHDIRIVLGSA